MLGDSVQTGLIPGFELTARTIPSLILLVLGNLEGFLFAWQCLKYVKNSNSLETALILLVSRMIKNRSGPCVAFCCCGELGWTEVASPLWPWCGTESGTGSVCRGRETEFDFLRNGKDYSGGSKTFVAVQGVEGGW